MFGKKEWGFIGCGFLIGTLGLKALKSEPARKGYVQGVAAGLRAKQSYEDIVEQAKAEVDDIVSEANFINAAPEAEAE